MRQPSSASASPVPATASPRRGSTAAGSRAGRRIAHERADAAPARAAARRAGASRRSPSRRSAGSDRDRACARCYPECAGLRSADADRAERSDEGEAERALRGRAVRSQRRAVPERAAVDHRHGDRAAAVGERDLGPARAACGARRRAACASCATPQAVVAAVEARSVPARDRRAVDRHRRPRRRVWRAAAAPSRRSTARVRRRPATSARQRAR